MPFFIVSFTDLDRSSVSLNVLSLGDEMNDKNLFPDYGLHIRLIWKPVFVQNHNERRSYSDIKNYCLVLIKKKADLSWCLLCNFDRILSCVSVMEI